MASEMDRRVAYWLQPEIEGIPPTEIIREIARRRGCEPAVVVKEFMVKAGIPMGAGMKRGTQVRVLIEGEDIRGGWVASSDATHAVVVFCDDSGHEHRERLPLSVLADKSKLPDWAP